MYCYERQHSESVPTILFVISVQLTQHIVSFAIAYITYLFIICPLHFFYHTGMMLFVFSLRIIAYPYKKYFVAIACNNAPWYLFSFICLIAVSADLLYFNSTHHCPGPTPAFALGINTKSANPFPADISRTIL